MNGDFFNFAPRTIEMFSSLIAEVNTAVPTLFERIATGFGLLVLSLCVVFWAWWISAQQKLKKSRLRIVGHSSESEPDADWRLLQDPEPLSGPPGNLVITMILISIVSQAFGLFLPQLLDPTINLRGIANASLDQSLLIILGNCVSQLLFIAAFIVLKQIVTRRNMNETQLPWIRVAPTSRDWLIGIIGWVAIVPLILILMTALSQYDDTKHPLIEKMMQMTIGQNRDQVILFVGVIGVSVTVLAPIAEEILFRGLIFGWFRRGSPQLPFWPANIFNGLLFGLAHWGQGLAPIALFFLALGLGYIYEKTGRLWPCIVVHGLLNLMTFVALVAQLKS